MAICRWGRRLTPKGLAAFGVSRGRAPCHASCHDVFRSIAAADPERALRAPVPPDSAAMVDAVALLKDLPIGAGEVVTGDAASPTVRSSRRSGPGEPAVSCSSEPTSPNARPGSRPALATLPPHRQPPCRSPDPRVDPPELERAATIGKQHGRIAVRPPPARLDQEWPGLVQVCRIERSRALMTCCERQVISAVTDLPQPAASAARLLVLSRPHWGSENRSRRVKDGTVAQDACRVRSDNAPSAPAHLRDGTLALIRRRGGTPKPARQACAANPPAAIRAILTASIEWHWRPRTAVEAGFCLNPPVRIRSLGRGGIGPATWEE